MFCSTTNFHARVHLGGERGRREKGRGEREGVEREREGREKVSGLHNNVYLAAHADACMPRLKAVLTPLYII